MYLFLQLLFTFCLHVSAASIKHRDDTAAAANQFFTIAVSQTYIGYPNYLNMSGYTLKFDNDGKGYVSAPRTLETLPRIYVDTDGHAFADETTTKVLYINTLTGGLEASAKEALPSYAITSDFLHIGDNPEGLVVTEVPGGYYNPAPALLSWGQTYGTWYICPTSGSWNTTDQYALYVKPFWWIGIDVDINNCTNQYLAALNV